MAASCLGSVGALGWPQLAGIRVPGLGCAAGVIAAKVRKLSLSTAHEIWGPCSVPAVCSIRELETFHSGSGSQPPPWSAIGMSPVTPMLPFLGVRLLRRIWCHPHSACFSGVCTGSGVSSAGLGGHLGSVLPGNQAGESLCHVWSRLLPMGCSSPKLCLTQALPAAVWCPCGRRALLCALGGVFLSW